MCNHMQKYEERRKMLPYTSQHIRYQLPIAAPPARKSGNLVILYFFHHKFLVSFIAPRVYFYHTKLGILQKVHL